MWVLFVCLGNICRSPAAEAVFAQLADERGLSGVDVDSAGTADYHEGETAHRNTLGEAAQRGVPIDHRSRPVAAADFDRFDLLVAVDRATERNLRRIAPPSTDLAKIVRLGDYAPGGLDVTDPWGHPQQAYTEMWDQLVELCGALLDAITERA